MNSRAGKTFAGPGQSPVLIKTSERRERAEARLRTERKNQSPKEQKPDSVVDSRRLLHELQVHHIELEMQNTELQEARDRMEVLLGKYTDFYDFAPVGYLSLDEQSKILEINLTGASLLGVERGRIINRQLLPQIAPANRPVFMTFLQQVFSGTGKKGCEAALVREDGKLFWADFHGTSAVSSGETQKWCRVVLTDITVRKQAEEAQRRLEALAISNEELKREIVQRQAAQESLKKSEQHQKQLLEQSRYMQEQLRHLSRQVLWAQEEERKRISRELHDVVAQTLTGLNIHLAALKKEAGPSTPFSRNIGRTQKLVEESVSIVHQFARELRPTVLDDLGLIPALVTFLKNFTTRTGVHTQLTAFAGVEKLDTKQRTVLFRVAQETLTNVSRHAQASRVSVVFQKQPGGIRMTIQDDGKSFDVEKVLQGKGKKRLGLLGMRERVEMVEGRLTVESTLGQGTTIEAWIPLVNDKLKNSPPPRVKRAEIKPKSL